MGIKTGEDQTVPILEIAPEAVHFGFSLQVACDDPYVDYVTGIQGAATYDDPDADAPLTLCTVEGVRIDVRTAHSRSVDLETLFDSLSAEISDFYHSVFEPGGTGRLRCGHGTHPAGEVCNVVYVSQLEVHPAARGMGIGSRMMHRLLRALDARESLVALKAFPLADDSDREVTLNREAAVARVKRFYRKLGFTPVADEFMVTDARTLAGNPV